MTNKLKQVNDIIRNLTAASEDSTNKLEQVNVAIMNLTRAGELQRNNLEERISNLTVEVGKQADTLVFINQRLGSSDCQEYRDHGYNLSGVYNIELNQISSVSRYRVDCDMTTNGGGWTVLLRRKDGSIYFNQNWEAYKNGFGDLSGEFWAGNELMYQLTSRPGKTYRLRVELCSYDNQSAYAEYDVFRIDSEHEFYGYTSAGTPGRRVTHSLTTAT